MDVEITGHSDGSGLHVSTPGRYAMDVAVWMLEHLDSLPGVRVKKTGWQNGFGLEVAVWVPIEGENLVARLLTDGSEVEFCRVAGEPGEFEAMFDSLVRFLNKSKN